MKLDTIRQSLANILSAAVKELYPKVKFGASSVTENGFYYDFNNLKISDKDLPKIEKKMKELIKKETKKDAFKLTKLAGAYWKGDEKNKMLTRIYGIAFETKKELDEYLKMQEQAEKRDHRKLGQKLELFSINEDVGAGLPLWHGKGAILRHIIENYLYEELTSQGYEWLTTPHIGKLSLWKTSGHWDFYRKNIYSPIKIEQEEYLLKPMNCPFHIKVYQSKIRSYKDLPIKFAELGTVYRYEKSGVLHGLTRVRGFTQDDAHIFCAPDQMEKELFSILKYGLEILKTFGFKDYEIYLSTRPKKFMGTKKMWQQAIDSLKHGCEKLKLKYQLDPEGGVFYGPKIDVKIKDSIERPWQCSTFQIDFNLPKAFNISYINEKGKKKEPIMIHRALLGSLERFIGVLLEHYEGALPIWLSPVQTWIIPITSRHEKYADEIKKKLGSFRIKVIDENETVSKKIRQGEIQKIPYIIVIGDEEMKNKTIRVRKRGKGDIGEIKTDVFIKKIKKEVDKKLN